MLEPPTENSTAYSLKLMWEGQVGDRGAKIFPGPECERPVQVASYQIPNVRSSLVMKEPAVLARPCPRSLTLAVPWFLVLARVVKDSWCFYTWTILRICRGMMELMDLIVKR